MNGGADLGGMMGFGPVVDEPGEPNFHADWEARVLGIIVALGACGQWNLDQSRFARESLPPATYLSLPYYTIWLEAAIKLMQARGMVTDVELAEGKASTAPILVKRCFAASDVESALNAGGPVDRPAQGAPTFEVGDAVHTINLHPESHTRLPRYARDKSGLITKVHGFHVYPDTNARGEGEQPTWLYQVSFTARTLWGEDRAEADTVTLDLWEPYLKVRT